MKIIICLCRWVRRFLLRALVWFKASQLPFAVDNILIIAPHQDDETFGCGGLIALAREQGADVQVFFLTRGEGAHRSCCTVEVETVGRARRGQAERACASLGVSADNLHWLNLPDGEIPAGGTAPAEIVTRLVDLIQEYGPSQIFVPVPFDCWPDHERAFDLVNAAFRRSGTNAELIGYPIWMWHNLRLRDLGRMKGWQPQRLDISAVAAVKQKALQCYLDEVNPVCGVPWCGNLPDGFANYFQRNHEIFFRRRGQS